MLNVTVDYYCMHSPKWLMVHGRPTVKWKSLVWNMKRSFFLFSPPFSFDSWMLFLILLTSEMRGKRASYILNLIFCWAEDVVNINSTLFKTSGRNATSGRCFWYIEASIGSKFGWLSCRWYLYLKLCIFLHWQKSTSKFCLKHLYFILMLLFCYILLYSSG